MRNRVRVAIMPKKPGRKRRTILRDGPDPIDAYVGNRVQIHRQLLGLSRTEMGQLLGVTFQQVQKYEKGTNRISASRLWRLAQIFDVPITWFFEGYGKRDQEQEQDPVTRRQALHLVRYLATCTPEVQRRIRAVIKALVDA